MTACLMLALLKSIEQSRHDITLQVKQTSTGAIYAIVVPDVYRRALESGCRQLRSTAELDG